MDFNGILGFAGLVIAAYSILDNSDRRELQYRFGFHELFASAIAVVIIHLLLFYKAFVHAGLVDEWGYPTPPGDIAYAVMLFAALYLYVRFTRFRLGTTRIDAFRRFIEEALAEGNYGSIAQALDESLDELDAIATGNWAYRKFHRTVARIPHVLEIAEGKTKPVWAKALQPLSRFLPSGAATETTAGEIEAGVLGNKAFAEWCSKLKPYFVLNVLKLQPMTAEVFLDNFFRAQIMDRASMLVHELNNTQETYRSRFKIGKNCRILNALFNDVRVAHAHGVYRPIGEALLLYLKDLREHPDRDDYNFPPREKETRSSDCPFVSGIEFFDIMVREALYQGEQWHMWLYYFPHLTESIARNVKFDPQLVDMTRSAPTRYVEVLNLLEATYRRWILLVREIPSVQLNVVLKSPAPTHENDNIIKSSILALCQHVHTIASDSKFPNSIVQSTIETPLYLYVELSKTHPNYAEALFKALAQGGVHKHPNHQAYLGKVIPAVLEWDDLAFEDNAKRLLELLVRDYLSQYSQASLQYYAPHDPSQRHLTFHRKNGGRIEVSIEGVD